MEYYCVDPKCDCRRVLLNVLPHRQIDKGYLAAISFGFDREAKWAGPFLNPLNPKASTPRSCSTW